MKGNLKMGSNVARASLSAVVTRADGRVENVGVVAYYHKNPVLCWLGRAVIAIRRLITRR